MLGENGAWGRIRTTDTRIFNPLLYQLSYPGAAPRRGMRSIEEGLREVQRRSAVFFQLPSSSSGASSASTAGTA